MPKSILDSVLGTVSRLPVERLHWLARDLGEPLARVCYRRRLVHGNLARAFPGRDATVLAEAFYAAFCQVCTEVVRALAMDVAELRTRVTVVGAEPLNAGSSLLLMAHHGNLVWAVSALAAELSVPVSVVYKTPHIPAMRELLLGIAKRFGVDLVSVQEVRRQLVAKRQRQQVWTLVADQRPGRERQYADLCGQRTAFFTGPERIARTFNWPVYYLSCQRQQAGRYSCVVDKIAEPPYERPGEVIERYAAKLQADIDAAPCDWLWTHDRWRE